MKKGPSKRPAKKPKQGPPVGIHAAAVAFKDRLKKGAKRKAAKGKETSGKATLPHMNPGY